MNILNDIAILKLAEEVDLNEFAQIACLPDEETFPPEILNQTAIAVGWGLLNEFDDFLPIKMHNVRLNIYNETMCENVSVEYEKDWSKQICAGKLEQSF